MQERYNRVDNMSGTTPERRLQMAERRAKQREDWIAEHGPCKDCGSSERLEVDHIDPAMKSYTIKWDSSLETLKPELAKCQVLCYICHQKKTRTERVVERIHGTASTYQRYKCKCDLCRANSRDVARRRRDRKIVI